MWLTAMVLTIAHVAGVFATGVAHPKHSVFHRCHQSCMQAGLLAPHAAGGAPHLLAQQACCWGALQGVCLCPSTDCICCWAANCVV